MGGEPRKRSSAMPLSVLSGGILCFAHPAASSRRAGDFPPRRGPGLIPHLLVHVGQKLWPSGIAARRAPEGREVRRTIGIRPCPPLPYFLSLSSEARPAGFSGASLPPYVSLCIAPVILWGFALPGGGFPVRLAPPVLRGSSRNSSHLMSFGSGVCRCGGD